MSHIMTPVQAKLIDEYHREMSMAYADLNRAAAVALQRLADSVASLVGDDTAGEAIHYHTV